MSSTSQKLQLQFQCQSGNMTSQGMSTYQQRDEGSPLTIVMPRQYHTQTSFINQPLEQSILQGLNIVSSPVSVQQTSMAVAMPSRSIAMGPRENLILSSIVGEAMETAERLVTTHKMPQTSLTGSNESHYSFVPMTSQSGGVAINASETLPMTGEQGQTTLPGLPTPNLNPTEHSSVDLVNNLLGSCGQVATLNTQQGQVFNVVILGDPINATISGLPTNIAQPGSGISSITTNTNVPNNIPGIPPGTLLLAVAPTPVNNTMTSIGGNQLTTSSICSDPLDNTSVALPQLNAPAVASDKAPSPKTSPLAESSPEQKEGNKDKREGKREKKFGCDLCEKSYYTSSHLKAHKRSHTGERPYICDFCGNCYHRPETLSAHRRIHLGIKRFECDMCGKRYGYYSHLNVHIKRVHKKLRPFSCETCGKGFTMKNNLRYHQKIHLIEKPHKCLECGRGFTYPTDLNRHMRGHTGEKKFTCDICQKAFSESGTMTRHKRKVHSGVSEPGEVTEPYQENGNEQQEPSATYECSECDKSFLQEQHLNFHRRTHHEAKDKSVKCSFCPRLFETLRCARAHENRMHLLDRAPRELYKCDICNEVLSTKKKLAEHKSTHYKLDDNSDYTNISTCKQENGYYKCNICEREFAFPAGLIVHRFSHSNVRPYTCKECGQSFKLRRYLTSHEYRCPSTITVGETSKSTNTQTRTVPQRNDKLLNSNNAMTVVSDGGSPCVKSSSEHLKQPTYEALTNQSILKSRGDVPHMRSSNCENPAASVDSLIEQANVANVSSLGNVVTSSGLVHVIFLSDKSCEGMSSVQQNGETVPLITSPGMSCQAGASILSPLAISSNNEGDPNVSDNSRISIKTFASDSTAPEQVKLTSYSTSPVGSIPVSEDLVHSSVDDASGSSSELTSSADPDFTEEVPFSKDSSNQDTVDSDLVLTGVDVSGTVDSEQQPLHPSSPSSQDNVVVYLSF